MHLFLLSLVTVLLSSVAAQDGFTWWINPNSTGDIQWTLGETQTLEWVTDYPVFSIVLYQYLGGNYTSTFLLQNIKLGKSSYDWDVRTIQPLTSTNNIFHLDILLSNNEANGMNSQAFQILPPNSSSFPFLGTSAANPPVSVTQSIIVPTTLNSTTSSTTSTEITGGSISTTPTSAVEVTTASLSTSSLSTSATSPSPTSTPASSTLSTFPGAAGNLHPGLGVGILGPFAAILCAII